MGTLFTVRIEQNNRVMCYSLSDRQVTDVKTAMDYCKNKPEFIGKKTVRVSKRDYLKALQYGNAVVEVEIKQGNKTRKTHYLLLQE